MRRFSLVLVMLFLCGCSSVGQEEGLRLRKDILTSQGCSFEMTIHADYGQAVYDFEVSCTADAVGTVSFELIEPESISGIGGKIEAGSGQLTFDELVLALPTLAEGELMPVYAPWIFLNTLRHGYIKDQGVMDDRIVLTIMDSYEEDALMIRLLLDENGLPDSCDVYWQGRSVLSMEVENFRFL